MAQIHLCEEKRKQPTQGVQRVFNLANQLMKPLNPHHRATVSQHPPVHHPLDARYYSVVHEPQLS
jgi:hypothetical protein